MEEFITDKWNDLLDTFPTGSKDIYFDESYVKLYEDADNKGVCYVYREDEQILLLPFLRRSFDFNGRIYYDFETAYGYGGPIANTDNKDFIHHASISFKTCLVQNNYIAGFIRFHPLLNNQVQFANVLSIIRDRQTIAMDLNMPEDEIWMKEIHSKNRNIIRKGINNGLSFIIDEEYLYLNRFIELYNSTMVKLSADKFYLFPDSYYHCLTESLNNVFLGVVLYEEKVISGALFFHSQDYGHYHLSGSDVNYLWLSPNNFMLYQAALEMKKRGVRKFHLGGGTTANENDSLFCFKERFSRSQYWFDIGKIIINESIYDDLSHQWETMYPKKKDKYGRFILKYKY